MGVNETEKYFGVADLVIFIALLLVSAVVGAYFAYKDRNVKSTDNYYFGDRKLSPFPVAMSMAVSFISAITVIGFPVETYLYGTVLIWLNFALIFSAGITAIYYIPLIHRLKLNTIYEYLELRYNKYVRKLCSGIVIPEMILYMGITVYLPALALEAVTSLDLNATIAMTSIICTFYTSIGGIKAVIWTDVLQGFVMLFGSLALFIKAVVMVGGLENVAAAVERGGRNNFLKFDPDPRERSSFFTLFWGFVSMALASSCTSQVYVQRYLSCKSASDARKATLMRIIPMMIFLLLAVANGLAMYAFFEGCDPKSAGLVDKDDQATPRLAMEAFHDMPGMAGLFVSAAYSGTLSTVSSGINCLAAMSTEDFIKPHWPGTSASKMTLISKGFSTLYGLLVMAVAYAISQLQSTVFQIAASFGGIIGGSILSVYTMGIFVPWTNSIGAFLGMIIGWIITAWISLSSVIYGAAPEFRETLPLTTEGCNFTSGRWSENFTSGMNTSATVTTQPSTTSDGRPPLADTLYSVSPFMYGLIGFLVGCFAMMIISIFTGLNKASDANPELFVPLLDNKKIFPEKVIKFFRLGVPERESKKFENGIQFSELLVRKSSEKDNSVSESDKF